MSEHEPVITAVSIDRHYESRRGYVPGFLGDGDLSIRVPWLSDEQYAQVAFNRWARTMRHVLPYHHFSVVMNRHRRQPFYTAVNIDGSQAQTVVRESDRWFYDPRIDREAQAGNEIYEDNPLDRGHLVRRIDPAWGSSEEVARSASYDTFHWTNCSPQHLSFNRSHTAWGGIEEYILQNARLASLKVTVFTGPVLRQDDPPYRGIQLPQQYWKVVATVKEHGTLSATAYLLSQARYVATLAEDAFAYGAYRTFQVPVQNIEALTDLSFFHLRDHDPLGLTLGGTPLDAVRPTGPLTSFDDLVL